MKLRHVHVHDTVGMVPNALNPLEFYMPTWSGSVFWVDLRCLDVGSCAAPGRYNGDFHGRPGLARSFARHIAEECRSQASYGGKLAAFKEFYYFLDEIDPHVWIDSVEDLNDAHGAQFLLRVPKRREVYKVTCSVVASMRKRKGLVPLLWPAPPEAASPKGRKQFDPKGIQRLFNRLKREARDVKLTLREGVELAAMGRDPRNLPRRRKTDRSSVKRDLAWLARDAFANGDLGAVADAQDPHLAHLARPRFRWPDLGPTSRGIVQWRTTHYLGKLRWSAPSKKDVLIFMALFLLSTGWNIDTAAALDIEGHWNSDHPGKPDFKILSAYKERARRDQIAFSLKDAEWRPYRIVVDMIAMTEPLRAIVRRRLAEAEAEWTVTRKSQLKTRIDELRELVRSPWLYYDLTPPFRVQRVVHRDADFISRMVREVADVHGLSEAFPELRKWSTSDARDFWIGHVYEQSDLDVISASLATGHDDLGTVTHYIGRPQFREFGEKRLRAVQDAAFAEIAAGRLLDATRVKLAIDGGPITEEEEFRLAGHRMRTRVGMGCRDPLRPPRSIAPAHPSGELCAVQRCSGCANGVVFDDSMPRLTRRLAQLLRIQARIPMTAWWRSSDEAEALSIDAILDSFDPGEVAASLARWDREFEKGEASDHATFPGH